MKVGQYSWKGKQNQNTIDALLTGGYSNKFTSNKFTSIKMYKWHE